MGNKVEDPLRQAVRLWWVPLLTGLLLVTFSIWMVFTPLASYTALIVIFSVVLTLSGLSEVASAINYRQTVQGWGWLLVGGLIDLTLGIYLVMNPAVTMAVLPLLLGTVLLLRGIFSIGHQYAFASSAQLVSYSAIGRGLGCLCAIDDHKSRVWNIQHCDLDRHRLLFRGFFPNFPGPASAVYEETGRYRLKLVVRTSS